MGANNAPSSKSRPAKWTIGERNSMEEEARTGVNLRSIASLPNQTDFPERTSVVPTWRIPG